MRVVALRETGFPAGAEPMNGHLRSKIPHALAYGLLPLGAEPFRALSAHWPVGCSHSVPVPVPWLVFSARWVPSQLVPGRRVSLKEGALLAAPLLCLPSASNPPVWTLLSGSSRLTSLVFATLHACP